MLGEFWKKDAEKRVIENMAYADKNAEVDADGVIRWKSNGNILMDDFCEVLEYGGYNFDRESTRSAREIQVDAQIRAYKESMKNHVYSDEELGEMRNAFGEGAVVVDVLTGQRIRL